MICGRSSETTYEQTEMWKPGNTSSVTAAPPSTCRRSSTSTRRPARARYAACVRPLWPPPITITSYLVTEDLPDLRSSFYTLPDADRLCVSRAHAPALRELELPRLGGLLRRQRLRNASRARIQRHSQRGRAHRRVAALQIHHRRTRRDEARRSAHHARCDEAGGRTSHLYARGATSRARSSTTERSRDWESSAIAGPPPIRVCDGSCRTQSGSTCRSKTCRKPSPPSPCRVRHPGALLSAGGRVGREGAEVFQSHERKHRRRSRRHLAHGLHRRSRLRNLDAVARRDPRLGRARGGRRAVRSSARRHARSRRGTHRGRPAAHRSGFLQLAEGVDRRTAVLTLRDGIGQAGSARERRRSSGSRRCGRSTRAGRPVRLSA